MALFWSLAAALTVVAVGLLLLPMWREHRGNGRQILGAVWPALVIVPVAVALYLHVSTHEVLDESEWRRLGDEYRQQSDFGRARVAYEEAWQLADVPDQGLKLGYAEMMLYTEPETAAGLAGELIDEVLDQAPGNQAALWLGGVVAVQRGDRTLAVDRWTAFLDSGPPAEIAAIVREQLMALLGAGAPAAASAPSAVAGTAINIEIEIGDDISVDGFGPAARLYLLARPPESRQPIVADQRAVSELPGSFVLSDANAMLGGSLGDYETVTVVARISASGNAIAAAGDVFAEATVAPGSNETVRLVLDQVVPDG